MVHFEVLAATYVISASVDRYLRASLPTWKLQSNANDQGAIPVDERQMLVLRLRNGDWHMERAIAHFKRSHPTRIEKLRVIVVDKDLNEIRVLEEHFPKARVIICHFHVIKYLKEKRSKPEFGKISSEDASHIDAAIHKMVYAQSEDKYKDANESLRGICVRTGMDAFFEYFQKNWDASQDRWVSYLRSKLPHFKNHTNNRLESFFGKLKDAVDGSMSMALCIKAIVAYDRRMQNEYEYRLSRIGRFVNSNYDEEMTNVLRFTTHYVAQQIEQQYAAAVAKSSSYNYCDSEVQSSQSQCVEATAIPQTVETVQVKDVGQFSRKQIETFKRVRNLKDVVELGLDTYKWMVEVGIPALPAEHHALAKEIAEEVKNTYPYRQIQGLPCVAEFQYGMLYRVTPPAWISDASIRALCLRLCQDFPECRFAGFQAAVVKTTRTRKTEKTVLSEDVRDCVLTHSRTRGRVGVYSAQLRESALVLCGCQSCSEEDLLLRSAEPARVYEHSEGSCS